jgi:hypothetical protein
MKTLTIETNRTSDINIAFLIIDLQDFDPHTGVVFICTFLNPNSTIIDRKQVIMSGPAWQNWGPSDDTSTDDNYVIDYCLEQLGFERKSISEPLPEPEVVLN